MKASRVILFVADPRAVADFYIEKLGLRERASEPGWIDLDAGGIRLALHRGKSTPARTKLCFYAKDVAAARAKLVAAGVRMGVVKSWDDLSICDGRDPAGNPFQISNRL